MDLRKRIAAIVAENALKQKELAALMGVTESYVSALLSGRNERISASLASLIEEKLGYSAQWVLTGEGTKHRQAKDGQALSEAHARILLQLEKMSDAQLLAVLAFIDSLQKVEKSFVKTESSH